MVDARNPTELLQRGQAAARVGRRAEAREDLGQAVEIDPGYVEAWLALAGVVDDPHEKKDCFEQVLSLDPDHVEAKLGLELLQPSLEASEPHDHTPGDVREDELEAVIAQASMQLAEAVGTAPADETHPDDEVLYCAIHPNRETVLRCNRCSKPICTQCAVQTPVGYRCKECVGRQQSTFYTGGAVDYVIAAAIALILGGLATFLMTMLRSWFIAIILGPALGIGIAEAVRLAVRRRRSRYLAAVVGVCVVVASLPALLLSLAGGNLWGLLTLGLFLVLAVGAAVARLR